MNEHNESIKKKVIQLNHDIDQGLQQLDQGQSVDTSDLLYKKLKDKYS